MLSFSPKNFAYSNILNILLIHLVYGLFVLRYKFSDLVSHAAEVVSACIKLYKLPGSLTSRFSFIVLSPDYQVFFLSL